MTIISTVIHWLNDGSWRNYTWVFTRATLSVSAVFAVLQCPSVRPSRWCIISTQLMISSNFLFDLVWKSHHSSFFDTMCRYPIPKGTPSVGCNIHGGGKNLGFSTEIIVYPRHCTRYANGYCRTLIGSHRWWIDPCQFRWPWVTYDPDFKVMTFFEVKYLKNGAFWDKVTIEH